MRDRVKGDRPDFDWDSPRWRDDDPTAQHLVEQERRFRDSAAPSQRGAIEDPLTITNGPGAVTPEQPAGPAEAEPA